MLCATNNPTRNSSDGTIPVYLGRVVDVCQYIKKIYNGHHGHDDTKFTKISLEGRSEIFIFPGEISFDKFQRARFYNGGREEKFPNIVNLAGMEILSEDGKFTSQRKAKGYEFRN